MLCPWPSPSVSPQEHPRELQEHGGGGEVPPAGHRGVHSHPAGPHPLLGPVPSLAVPSSMAGTPLSPKTAQNELWRSCQNLAGAQRRTALWHLRLHGERCVPKARSNSKLWKEEEEEERPCHCLTESGSPGTRGRHGSLSPVPTWMAARRASRAFSSRIFLRSSSLRSCKPRMFPSSVCRCLSCQEKKLKAERELPRPPPGAEKWGTRHPKRCTRGHPLPRVRSRQGTLLILLGHQTQPSGTRG